MVVFTLQLVAGTLAFAFRGEVSTTLVAELQAGIRRSFNETSENAVAITWDHLQTQFQVRNNSDNALVKDHVITYL